MRSASRQRVVRRRRGRNKRGGLQVCTGERRARRVVHLDLATPEGMRYQWNCAACGEHEQMFRAEFERLLDERPWRQVLCAACLYRNTEFHVTCQAGHEFTFDSDALFEARDKDAVSRLTHCRCNRGARTVTSVRLGNEA